MDIRQTKLFLLIETLEKKELKQLNEFLKLPLLPINNNHIILIQYLIKQTKRRKAIKKSWLIKHLFKNDSTIIKNWKQLFNVALEAVKQFIVFNTVSKSKEYSHPILIDHYQNHGLNEKMISPLFNQFSAEIEKEGMRNYNYHFHRFQLFHWKAISLKLKEDTTSHIKEALKSLDAYFIENKLRLYAEIINKQIDYKNEFESSDIAQIPLFREKIKTDEVVYFFHGLYDYMLKDKQTNLDSMIAEFQKIDSFPHFDSFLKKSLLEQLSNYCIIKINNREKGYAEKWLSLNNRMEQEGLLLDNNVLSWQRFKNIITTFILVGRQDQLQTILDKHINHLDPLLQEATKNLTTSKIKFNKKEMDTALKTLLEGPLKKNKEKVSTKRLLLKIYFEDLKQSNFAEDERKPLVNLCRSFKKFMQRDKQKTIENKKNPALSNLIHTRVRNFINLVLKLSRQENVHMQDLDKIELYGVDYLWLVEHIG